MVYFYFLLYFLIYQLVLLYLILALIIYNNIYSSSFNFKYNAKFSKKVDDTISYVYYINEKEKCTMSLYTEAFLGAYFNINEKYPDVKLEYIYKNNCEDCKGLYSAFVYWRCKE